MVNKRDVKVFIVCLFCQELAWDSKSSSMSFGYSYFMGHEVFNL
jgi:hypothetical protein